MTILHWSSGAPGRSRTVAFNGIVWTVANTIDLVPDFEVQVEQSLAMLDAHLREAGSCRRHILSIQVILADIERREAFDRLWQGWIGNESSHWPQRACFQSALAHGLQIELVATAAQASATLLLEQRETR